VSVGSAAALVLPDHTRVADLAPDSVTDAAARMSGVENALGWGVAAAILHTIPYIGPMVIALEVFLISFDPFGVGQAALAAALLNE
jgi:hypothetical protein